MTTEACQENNSNSIERGKNMLLKMTTHKPLTVTAADLQAAVQKHRFGVMQVHNLKETMAKKDVRFDRE